MDAESAGGRRSALRPWLAAGAVVVAAVLVWQVVWQVVPTLRRGPRTTEVQSRLDAAYAKSSVDEASQRAALIDDLRPVLGSPAFSSRQLYCYVSDSYNDYEAVADGWYEQCTLRSVDVYAWESPGDDVSSPLLDLAGGALRAEGGDRVDACGALLTGGEWGVDQTRVEIGRVSAGRWTVSDTGEPGCILPAPLVPYSDGTVLTAFDVGQVDRDKNWVYVQRTRDFFADDLGCLGFLCRRPVNGVPLPRT